MLYDRSSPRKDGRAVGGRGALPRCAACSGRGAALKHTRVIAALKPDQSCACSVTTLSRSDRNNSAPGVGGGGGGGGGGGASTTRAAQAARGPPCLHATRSSPRPTRRKEERTRARDQTHCRCRAREVPSGGGWPWPVAERGCLPVYIYKHIKTQTHTYKHARVSRGKAERAAPCIYAQDCAVLANTKRLSFFAYTSRLTML